MYISDISGENTKSRNSYQGREAAAEAIPVNYSVEDEVSAGAAAGAPASETGPDRRIPLRIARNYLIVALICAAVGLIYEAFSHNVWSVYMLGAFAIPLALGFLPNVLIAVLKLKTPGIAAENLYACGIATLTLGSMLTGVLEIFGTTNGLISYYWMAGAGFTVLGTIFYLAQKKMTA
mgnify:CR=1 FL=1